jgi:hypothetical protein
MKQFLDDRLVAGITIYMQQNNIRKIEIEEFDETSVGVTYYNKAQSDDVEWDFDFKGVDG